MSAGHQASKEKLTKMLQQRELDVRGAIARGEEDEKINKTTMIDFKNEIEYLNQQIIKLRSLNQESINANENLKADLDRMFRENKFLKNQNEVLESDNKFLISSNDELKLNVKKLERILYGNNIRQY